MPDWLMGDPARLHQVLTRILENAVKFSSGGEVLVSVQRESEIPLTSRPAKSKREWSCYFQFAIGESVFLMINGS